jgi:Methylamine utilisation protein MauE
MDAALLIARLVLAAVFSLAGVAKLSDLKGSRRAIIDFGVPSAIAAPLGLLLPVAELSVAATLLLASTAWLGALGAMALLSVFVVGITYNLARGRKPECHCFGQLHSAPAGWKALARNGESSRPLQGSSFGQAPRAVPVPALSPGSERFQRPSCWLSWAG